MSKINYKQAQRIIDEFVDGSNTLQLAEKFSISRTTVRTILRGDAWKQCRRPRNIQLLIDKQRAHGTHCKDLPPLTELQNDVLIGSLLGDGYLQNLKSNMSNSHFNKQQTHSKKPYLDWHMHVFSEYGRNKLMPIFSNKKPQIANGVITHVSAPRHLSAYVFRTFNHPTFTALRRQWYPNDIKKVPNDLVLNPQRIAIWFFDDGCNDIKQRVGYLCTNCFTIEEVELLSAKLNAFNVYPKIAVKKSTYGRKMPILKFSRGSYDNLIEIIKPYMLWDCFAYKTQWRPAQQSWETHGKLTEEQVKQIIVLKKTKTAKELSKQFNVCMDAIYKIASGRSWRHLTHENIS